MAGDTVQTGASMSTLHMPVGDAELEQEKRRRAVRYVASRAANANDCDLLLEALGLDPHEGKATT